MKASLAKCQEGVGGLVELHEQYVKLIEDDNKFEMERNGSDNVGKNLWK